MNSVRSNLALAAVLVCSLTVAPVAIAADAVSPGEPASVSVPDELFQRSLLIGGGAGFEPLYEGSGKYRAFPFPIISYNSGKPGPRRFEFRALDDIRLHVLRTGRFSFGPIAGYSFGRDEDDSSSLRDLGDIDGGLILGGFAAYEFHKAEDVSWSADVGISTQVTGDAFDVSNRLDHGYVVDLGLTGDYAVSDQLNIETRFGTIYASDNYMRTHFGISTAQAAAAAAVGNPIGAFDADAGFKNVYAEVSMAYELTENIQLRAGAGYSRLLNDAADSPITEDKNQFSGSIGGAYRIGF